MAGILEARGKDVLMVNDFAIPPTLTFLDPQHKVKQLGKDISPQSSSPIAKSSSCWTRPPGFSSARWPTSSAAARRLKVVLDHHVSSDDLGAEFFKNTEAEATGRLVVEAADALGVPLTPEIAAPAFAALATDTGWFRFSSTTAGYVAPGRPAGGGRREARPALQAALRARQRSAACG